MKRLISLILIICLFSGLLVAFAGEERVSCIIITEEDFDVSLFKPFGEIIYTYSLAFFGFSSEIYESDIEEIKKLPGIISVRPDGFYEPPVVFPAEEVDDFALFEAKESFDGEGMLVAVIDASFKTTHEIYSLDEGVSVKYTSDDMKKLVSEESFNSGSKALYISDKIPFAYNYGDKNTTMLVSSVYHGTAVSGIIGGNSKSYKGVMPNVQLGLLRVMSSTGQTSDSSLFAAFEDAVRLGADGINISLGKRAGFSYISHTVDPYSIDDLISAAREKGIFVAVAAGNDCILDGEGLSKVNNNGGFPDVTNTDYGMVASPSASADAVSVAAVNQQGSSMGYFSSAGPTPSLELKPDISANGVSYDIASNSGYRTGSGTSFASPDLCARYLTVKKHLLDKGVSEAEISGLAENMMMSNADVIYDSKGNPISPRYQGSGFINTDRAVNASAILYNTKGKSKIELKDNLDDSFSFTFTVENISGKEISYTPSLSLITDGYSGNKINGKSIAVPHTVSFSPSVISLSAGSAADVRVNVRVDSAWSKAHSEIFTNGFYIEGFVTLENLTDIVSMPFMGYHGSWLSAPVFMPESTDKGFGFADYLVSSKVTDNLFYLGNNYFVSETALNIKDTSKTAFSPNGDGIFDRAKIYLGFYRNTKLFYWEIQDEEGNEVISNGYYYLPKSVGGDYLGNNGICWDGKDSKGNKMPDGQYKLYAAAILDYGSMSIADECERPVFLDTTLPEIENIRITNENGKRNLSFTLSDNHQIQVSALTDENGKEFAMNTEITSGEVSFDITEITNEFILEASDYAFNVKEINITLADKYTIFYENKEAVRITLEEFAYYDGCEIEKPQLEEGETNAKVLIWKKNMQPLVCKNY